jgi:hypothetical protein
MSPAAEAARSSAGAWETGRSLFPVIANDLEKQLRMTLGAEGGKTETREGKRAVRIKETMMFAVML